MLDPDMFMKNSPFQLAHGDHYNLSNTTPELLKFQLQEQNRMDMEAEPALAPLLLDLSFNSHLQSRIFTKLVSIDDLNEEFLREESGLSTPASDVSEQPTKNELHTPNYLNLKILIENSVFDTAKMSQKSIMALHKVKKLKMLIADKQEHKEYLQQRLTVSNQFFSTLIFNSPNPELDSALVTKMFKQNTDLQQQFVAVSVELDTLTTKLNNHNLACLVLGYVEDVKFHSHTPFVNSEQTPDSSKSFETLFAHIASVAVQNNVALPEHPVEPETNSLQAKVEWAQNCIDAILASRPSTAETAETSVADRSLSEDNSMLRDHSFLSASPYKAYNNPQDKILLDYKMALDDLRFSHKYFMKEYDYLKENSLKTILDYRKKNALLEKEVHQNRHGSSSPDGTRETLDAKDKEIAKLRKELSALKIECLGNKSPRNSTIASPSLLPGMEDEAYDSASSVNYTLNALSSMSNAILRREFKKIVTDIQDEYEVELAEERLKRRHLEEAMQKFNQVS